MSLTTTAQIHTLNHYLAETNKPSKVKKPEQNPHSSDVLVAGSFNPSGQMTHATIPVGTDGPLSFAP
jgi:hypothetical protein